MNRPHPLGGAPVPGAPEPPAPGAVLEVPDVLVVLVQAIQTKSERLRKRTRSRFPAAPSRFRSILTNRGQGAACGISTCDTIHAPAWGATQIQMIVVI